jgi:hypothetical protein
MKLNQEFEVKTLKIILFGHSSTGGGCEQVKAYQRFLLSKNHEVEIAWFPGSNYSSKAWYYYQSVRSRMENNERRQMIEIANKLEKRIRNRNYDVAIAFGVPFAYVFTKEIKCLKLFCPQTSGADEVYFSKTIDVQQVHNLREMELEVMAKADYVIFPWDTIENYVKKYVLNSKNLITIKYGCYPQKNRASYFFPISIVSLGNLSHYWANKELLSNLTKRSPYLIDVYGQYKPQKQYNIRYKGYAPSIDVLRNYQFGLNTISKDPLRQNDHSSRIMPYLAYGLPVLSPEWMKFSNSLKGCLPYNEENFIGTVEKYSEKEAWDRISQDAYQQALDLDWNKTLESLETLIQKQAKP